LGTLATTTTTKKLVHTSMETNLGTTWLSYHGACCPDLALKVIILIIGKFGKKKRVFNWESIEDQLGTSL
jgi:hypothetical protein